MLSIDQGPEKSTSGTHGDDQEAKTEKSQGYPSKTIHSSRRPALLSRARPEKVGILEANLSPATANLNPQGNGTTFTDSVRQQMTVSFAARHDPISLIPST